MACLLNSLSSNDGQRKSPKTNDQPAEYITGEEGYIKGQVFRDGHNQPFFLEGKISNLIINPEGCGRFIYPNQNEAFSHIVQEIAGFIAAGEGQKAIWYLNSKYVIGERI